ncbi:unnamed protein product [Cuscuta campestris]|uniref:Protein NUCLEAR FUSION DEFECTIVE 6, chloroplastic/mitochondrial n=1 Tax=Cuscuta campestris TaxID=132261 RepID=A0A484LQI8_9ASTE|nr:unnamed protein product [Cuscuta campestris]
MAAVAAARSVFRSATSSARSAATRLSTGAKFRASASQFRFPTQKPLTARIFRSPMELGCVRVETMLPYHTATASSLLNSMISIAPRSRAWSIEDL